MVRDTAYMKVEVKIEEARRSGAKELDLRGDYGDDSSRLTELPEARGQLTHLQSLNVSNNQLTSLPDWIGELNQLQELNLSNNHLTELPDWLCQLTHLQSLRVSNNQLRALPESLGQLTQLGSLHLIRNELTTLPESIGSLHALKELWLHNNAIRKLPESFSRLANLESLGLFQNELGSALESVALLSRLKGLWLGGREEETLPLCLAQLINLEHLYLAGEHWSSLPDWLGKLPTLVSLDLSSNQLTAIPNTLAQLTKLQRLELYDNRLTDLPDWLVQLTELQELNLYGNQLTELPEWMGQLTKLKSLALTSNKLAMLPPSLVQLEELETLDLEGNPLSPELSAASDEGFAAVLRYLQELAKGARKRYEAKLLILGDGNEGKTCVSRAIRDLPFQAQVTTRGVDVEQWKFEHPDHAGDTDKAITLNIWDFEGQEINHQTHQFFLTAQALYLLVFKCRDQFPMGRAEYWLDTIRARAPHAKVAIIISECEERTPYVPQDKLQAQYGDLLADGEWLFGVGCENNLGVGRLRDSLKRWAADLEFMGREWPKSYSKAEEAIKEKAKDGIPHITRRQLYDIFMESSIDESIFNDLAGSMSTLGVMTQFPDCPDLRDFIVLQPQWLTKAISEIMEDRQLATDQGEIALRRMESIWDEKDYGGLFSTFHDCMKEFELCYDLEDVSRNCLVPLRFGYERPLIPWSDGYGLKERRVEYKLNIRPPTGLMSRFIVKTHHMMLTTAERPKGVYWHNGVFLRTGKGPLASEALCEFDGDLRELHVHVRAAFPQNLLEQIHGYVKAVFSFFSGVEAERSYGCIKIDDQTETEVKCVGMHSERRIYSAIRKQRVLDCEYEFHDVDPQKLIWGFSTFGEYILTKVASIGELREELDKQPKWAETLTQNMMKLLSWVDGHQEIMTQLVNDQAKLLPRIKQQLELKLHEYLAYTSVMLDDREYTAAPGIISISTKDRSKWSPSSYFSKTYLLTPFCESPDNIHPCEDGKVEFTKGREWWETTAPWIARGTKLLAAGLQLAFAGMPLVLGAKVFDEIKDHLKLMGELSKHIELKAGDSDVDAGAEVFQRKLGGDIRGTDRESRSMRVGLAHFLEEAAPVNYHARQWGSLRRVRMSDNSYRWICEACSQ